MLRDPAIVSLVGMVSTPSLKIIKSWTLPSKMLLGRGGRLTFAIVHEGAHVGNCGFNYINFRDGEAEVFIYLAAEHRGKGFGKDAMALLLDYAFGELRLNRVAAKVLSSNAPGVKLFEALGFIREGILREAAYRGGRYQDVYLYAILRSDWCLKLNMRR